MKPVFYQRRLNPNFGISWYWFKRLTIAVLAIVFANICWDYANFAMSLYRVNRFKKEADVFLAQNRNEEALMSVQKALFLIPDHIESCRLMARLLDEKGDARSLEYYRFVALQNAILPSEIQLGEGASDMGAFFDGGGDVVRSGDRFLAGKERVALAPHATREDAMRLALAAVKYGRPVVAWDVSNMLSAKWKNEFFPHLIKASINEKMGDFQAQELELRTALSKSETTETLRAYYEFLSTHPDHKPERSAEMVRLLDKMTRLDSTSKSLSLCIQAIESNALDAEYAPALLQLIRNHPAADFNTLLFADKFQWNLQSASRPQILQVLVQRLLATPPAERLPAVDWLLDINQPALAQSALPLSDAIKNARTFQMWVEVAIALKQWNALEKALADSANPLPAYQAQTLEATIAGIKGDSAKSRKLWSELLLKNRDHPEIYLEILVTLARIAEWKIIYAEMPVLLKDEAWARKTVDTLIPVVSYYRDSALTLEFYRQALKCRVLASDNEIKDRVAYTCLVLGEPVSTEESEKRAKKNPENASFRITQALAAMRSGAKVKALFNLKEVDPPVLPDNLLPHQKSIYAIALVLNGQEEEAQAVKKTIPPGSLTRQEEALQAVLSGAKMGN